MTSTQHPDLCVLLQCPHCKSRLHRAGGPPALTCPTHGLFRWICGMPSFANGSEEFDGHWLSHDSDPVPGPKLQQAENFLGPILPILQGPEAVRLLDVGCGDGVHVAALKKHELPAHSLCVGTDVSIKALESASRRGGERWAFVHADALHLPFADDSFDVVFSFGVLAYVPDPAGAFAEMCRVVRPGGWIGLWVLTRLRQPMHLMLVSIRAFCRLTGRWGTRAVANLLVPFLSLVPSRSQMNLRNANWRQCREVVLVNIAPHRLCFPRREEVQGWFHSGGVIVRVEDPAFPTTLWGVKE